MNMQGWIRATFAGTALWAASAGANTHDIEAIHGPAALDDGTPDKVMVAGGYRHRTGNKARSRKAPGDGYCARREFLGRASQQCEQRGYDTGIYGHHGHGGRGRGRGGSVYIETDDDGTIIRGHISGGNRKGDFSRGLGGR